MSKFTEEDVGHHFTYKDTSAEWRLDRIKDGFCHWSTETRSMSDARHIMYTTLRGYPVPQPNGGPVPDERLFKPMPTSKFVTPDIGDTYRDKWSGREWKLFNIADDGICTWHQSVPNHPDNIMYTRSNGQRCTISGDLTSPEQRPFNPADAPVKVGTEAILTPDSVGERFVDDKGGVWQCLDFEGGTYGVVMVTPHALEHMSMRVLPSGFPVSSAMPKQWTRRIVGPAPVDTELVEKAAEIETDHPDMLVDVTGIEAEHPETGETASIVTTHSAGFDAEPGHNGASFSIGYDVEQAPVQSGKTERVKEMIEESRKLTQEEIIEMGKHFSYGKYPKRELLPTDALAMVQQLLVDPGSLNMHEHLGVRSERFYLAHSVCAQLFRLERLIREMD